MRIRAQAPLAPIFVAQAVDNAVTLLSAFLMMGAAMSLYVGDAESLMTGAGPSFWFGLGGVMFACGLFYRTFFIWFRGATLGMAAAGLSADFDLHSDPFAFGGLLTESLHGALPVLWALDLGLRALDFRLGLRYFFAYESRPQLG